MRNQFEFDYFRVTVRVWRRRVPLTIGELSELSGVSPTRLGIIENGGGTPTMAELTHLCDLMDEKASTFFKTAGEVRNDGN